MRFQDQRKIEEKADEKRAKEEEEKEREMRLAKLKEKVANYTQKHFVIVFSQFYDSAALNDKLLI